GNPASAFLRSTKPWRSIFRKHPAGWGRKSRRQLREVVQATDTYIQTLNDQFTNPSGSEKLLASEPQQNPLSEAVESEERDPA
ncbi:MAG: dynamin family protein, partial [Candidatus Thiodiazotropha sp. (ex Semelilucina semeliformis)]|nr:dynamin family protein [Candidatus Thiodiazotropha sp. (ex Semelilucina semeliformis)]